MLLKECQTTTEVERRPRVGVGVCIIKDNKVLLLRRKGSHGAGTWSFPGGHLELWESPQKCAIREVGEEVGIEIKNLRQGPFTNDFMPEENRHYVTLFVIADYKSGEPEILEETKCQELRWFDWDNLPKPLFKPLENLIKSGFDPFLC